MVAFDNTILSLLMFEGAELRDGNSGALVEHARERVAGLVQELEERHEQIVVPTPALAELLVTDGIDMQNVVETLRASAHIRVESFDALAAVELATRLREARHAGDQREGLRITKSAMKFDRQIVSIALVTGSRVLYSDDVGVATFAAGCGLPVVRVVDLPIPQVQDKFEFQDPDQGRAPE